MGSRLTQLMQSLVQAVRDPCQQSAWQPAADVYRVPGGWLVKFELAGIRPQEVELSARGRLLVIVGARRDRLCRQGHRSHSMEISYNRFERSIEFPCEVQDAELSVDYEDGMFMVRLTTGQAE